jgi:hypothetical protein
VTRNAAFSESCLPTGDFTVRKRLKRCLGQVRTTVCQKAALGVVDGCSCDDPTQGVLSGDNRCREIMTVDARACGTVAVAPSLNGYNGEFVIIGALV